MPTDPYTPILFSLYAWGSLLGVAVRVLLILPGFPSSKGIKCMAPDFPHLRGEVVAFSKSTYNPYNAYKAPNTFMTNLRTKSP